MNPPAKIDKVDWTKPRSKAGLDALVTDQLRGEINRGLPAFMRGQADRLIRAMMTECSRTPDLLDCSPASLFGAVIQAGQLGLTIGGPLGESYIIGFWSKKKQVKEATLIVGYKGFLNLAHRSALVRRVTPRVVREGDDFAVRYGTGQGILHIPKRDSDGPVTDYYVVVETVSGGVDFEVATVAEMMAFRDRYSMVRTAEEWVRKKSPWYDITPSPINNGFDSMSLKTLIRRMAKRMPLSPELACAAGLDEMADAGVPQRLDQHIPDAEPAVADDLQDRLDGAAEYVPGVDDPDHDPDTRANK